MDNMIFYSDVSENLKYNLELEGANLKNTWTRLCLEFESGKNLYFQGTINEYGQVNVKLPIFAEENGQKGKLKIEVVADNTFFELYNTEFEIKKKINVGIKESLVTLERSEEIESVKPKVSLSFVNDTTSTPKEDSETTITNRFNKTFKDIVKNKS